MGRNLIKTILLTGFLFIVPFIHRPGFVHLQWNEEVKLPDGRVIVAQIRHIYFCYDYRFREFGGTCSPEDTILTLNTGAGVVTQLFKGFQPMFLGEKQGIWYAILIGAYRQKNRQIPGQDWGDSKGPYGQLSIRLVDGKWRPMDLCDFPDDFKIPNMLLQYAAADELAVYDRHHITLVDKQDYIIKHPPGYSDVRIAKPSNNSRFSCNKTTATSTKEDSK